MLSENPLSTADNFANDANNIGVYEIKTITLQLNKSLYGSYNN